MSEKSRRFAKTRRGVVVLASLHLTLGAAWLYVMLAWGIVGSFRSGALLGLSMMVTGAVTSGVLTHHNARLAWLWILTFSVWPFVYTVPSLIRYINTGDTLPLTFWITFPLGVALSCYVGSLLGAEYELRRQFRQPTRGRFLRMLIRWLS